jgi:cytochrome c biogenesis protein CcmG/thiol:disulfide interchange protein DsbE
MTGAAAPERSRRRIWVGSVVVLIVVGGLIAVFASRFGKDPRLVDSPLIGEQVSALQLEYLDGTGSVSFDDLRGQVVVMNFWASWCIPCRTEHRHLTSTAEAYADRDVQFVGVVFQDEVDDAERFLDELGWGEGYLYVLDPGSRAAVEFGVFGVPETFFIDPDGRIVHKVAGPVDTVRLTTALDAILAGETPS